MAYLLNYTRQPVNEKIYDPRLAYSMHLAISKDGREYQALNHNSGVLFAKATENEDGSLNAKSLKNPWLFALPHGGYGVAAVRVEGDGEADAQSRGSVLLFATENLTEYRELGLLKLGAEYIEQVACMGLPETGTIRIVWQEQTGNCFSSEIRSLEERELIRVPVKCEGISQGIFRTEDISAPAQQKQAGSPEEGEAGLRNLPAETAIEGAVPRNAIEIPEETAEKLRKSLLTPVNTGVEFPEQIQAANLRELEGYLARALYSDGSSAWKRIDWNLSEVDFSRNGTYALTGKVHQEHYAFPIAYDRADPCIGRWGGKYYFIATNDADGNRTLYIREADTIPGLLEAEEHLLLDSETYPGIGGLLWAPEFHEINGRLYIFHAATPGEFFWEESHVMELKEGGNPIRREDWSAPKRVVRKDGSDLCEAGKEITLDMTCFEWQGEYYAVWSQRQFLPKDLGAWLYIAKLDPKEPWKLLTDPVILSKPEYGWANNHTFVDEGPFALPRENRLYLTFSSAAVDTSYVVGLLSIEKGLDLLDAGNWKKKNYPILTSRSVAGEFGTGHNAYVTDEDGTVWNSYHARPGVDGVRSSGIRRVHFNAAGEPVLDMTEELDVREAYSKVKTLLTVR